MKKMLLAGLVVLVFAPVAMADQYVRGYTRSNGTYVEGHYRSDANNTQRDNWSTRGNVNPYTGEPGTKKDCTYGCY